ncbi:hypothetical protein K504DRAFT_343073, partial [Pleomassaria siparia CBS 279.74]
STSTPKSSDHFSISNLISRFRSRHRRSTAPPKDARPPLQTSPLPLVLSENQQTLGRLGWTVVTFPQPQPAAQTQEVRSPSPSILTPTAPEHVAPGTHPLQQASADLFAASQAFFNLPDEEKEKWKTRLGSEEGWSKIPGEKEFITLRTLAYTPDVLKGPANRYWDLMGAYLDTCLSRINGTLAILDGEDQGLRAFVGSCRRLGEKEEDKTATMLRLFRYESWEEKVVAEPHADLGLLSIVVGDVPGLEVWNGKQFFPIEKNYINPSATLLGGRQLERLSNYRYPAGGHRVVSYGRPKAGPTPASAPSSLSPESQPPKYRFSIVFVLRAYEPAIVNSDLLETEITGKWKAPVKGVTAGKMYDEIRRAHFNINTDLKEREEQRRKLAA